MTNPGDAVGTNGAYGGRTSVNAFNDVLSAFSGRGILQGWGVAPGGALNVKLGGSALARDVAIAENDLGQRTTINNISTQPITVELEAAPTLGSRIDTIVAYVNNPPDAIITDPIQIDNPSVCGLIAVTGNVSNTPTAPDEAMIRTAITADGAAGSTAYYVVLGTVAISAGMTTVTQSNITQGASSTLGAAGIADGSVTTAKLADGAVDSSKLAQGAVKSENVDWTITTKELTVDTSKVLGGEISCSQWGKIVRLNFNDIQFTGDNLTRWSRFATGGPLPAANTRTTGLLAQHGASGDRQTVRIAVDVTNGDIVLNYNNNVAKEAYYSGFLMYFAA